MSLSEPYEKAVRNFEDDRPFVLYRKPAAAEVYLLEQENNSLHYIADFSESGFVMAPFSSDELAVVLRPGRMFKADYASLNISAPEVDPKQIEDADDKYNHISLIEDAVLKIKGGSFDKIVLSRPIRIPYNQFPLHAFNRLISQHLHAFCYLWYHPQKGLWLGASPELLLSTSRRVVRTYSVAGTIPYSQGEEPKWGPKEKDEQAIVTNYILNQLSALSIDASASGPVSYRAGNLWHLKTEIEAAMHGKPLQQIINALHPTPAICGVPKAAAMVYIQQGESYDRKYYTGFLGELNLERPGNCSLYVNLRCMEWNKETAVIYVGGGITDKSVALDEWIETEQKSRTILDALLN